VATFIHSSVVSNLYKETKCAAKEILGLEDERNDILNQQTNAPTIDSTAKDTTRKPS